MCAVPGLSFAEHVVKRDAKVKVGEMPVHNDRRRMSRVGEMADDST